MRADRKGSVQLPTKRIFPPFAFETKTALFPLVNESGFQEGRRFMTSMFAF